MAITGNLKTMELAELLQWLSQGRKTGTLFIDNTKVEKRIFFKNGNIVSSAASDPKEYLGHFLVSHGYIDEITLAKAIEMQEENKMLLGKILLAIGAIAEDELDRMLKLKAEESIFELFTWQEADFRFADGDLPDYQMVPVNLSVTGLVLEGHRRLDEWKEIRRHIPNANAIPVATGDFVVEGEDPGVEKILSLVDDDRTIQEIAIETHSGEFHVCRVLYHQIRAGRLKVVRPRQMQVPDTETTENKATVELRHPDADSLLAAADDFIGQQRYDLALRHLRAAKSLEPNSVKVQQLVSAAENKIKGAITDCGISLTSIPVLCTNPEDLNSLEISPQEGFVLTRVNGSYDIQTILKITPVPPLEAQVVFWKLLEAGHIELH